MLLSFVVAGCVMLFLVVVDGVVVRGLDCRCVFVWCCLFVVVCLVVCCLLLLLFDAVVVVCLCCLLLS